MIPTDLFPPRECVRALAELSLWTRVEHILSAARVLEGRPDESDEPSTSVLIPFPDNDEFEEAFAVAVDWFVDGYSVPPQKIDIACALDGRITEATASQLREVRTRPEVRALSREGVAKLVGEAGPFRGQRAIWFNDSSHTIEMVRSPLNVMRGLLGRTCATASEYATLAKSRGMKLAHRPYADGPIFAVLEALAFHVYGLPFGPLWAPKEGTPVAGFRAINIWARPPLDRDVMAIGTQVFQRSQGK